MNLLLRTTLSAIFFSAAFFLPEKLAFLIFFSFIFLYKIFLLQRKRLTFFATGFLWGFIAYGLHFVWFLELLISKFFINYFFISLIYIAIVLYVSVLTACFFLVTKICINFFINKILKKIIFLFCLFIYFLFLTNYSIWFVGKIEGYPFINPILPLISWCPFKMSLAFKVGPPVFYLKPLNCFDKNLTACRVGQHIYHELANLNLEEYKDKFENLIIVGPETTYPFFLNKNLEQIKLWDSILPSNAQLILGSQRLDKKLGQEKIFQTVYLINQCRIINFYDKKHCVKLVEKTPKSLKNLKIIKNFLKNKLEFSRSKTTELTFFKISDEFKIIPIICSEIFFLNLNKIKKLKNKEKDLTIFLFVNDSWFMSYFKKLMKNFVILTSYKLDLPILYVGWPEKI